MKRCEFQRTTLSLVGCGTEGRWKKSTWRCARKAVTSLRWWDTVLEKAGKAHLCRQHANVALRGERPTSRCRKSATHGHRWKKVFENGSGATISALPMASY